MSDKKSVTEVVALIQRVYRKRFSSTNHLKVKLEMTSRKEYDRSEPTETFNAYLMYDNTILAYEHANSFEEAIVALANQLDV